MGFPAFPGRNAASLSIYGWKANLMIARFSTK
jgi:hypothetical protein